MDSKVYTSKNANTKLTIIYGAISMDLLRKGKSLYQHFRLGKLRRSYIRT